MEEIYVVDQNDKFVRKSTRQEVREKALLHRSIGIIILNKEGKFVIQKRSMNKDIYPGYWDIGVAGTVRGNDSYESTVIREVYEEIGVTGISNTQLMGSFLFELKYLSPEHNVLCKVYKIIYNGKLKPQKEEIEDLKLLTNKEIKALISKNLFHPIGALAFKKYLDMQTNQKL